MAPVDAATSNGHASQHALRVLVVDDEPLMRWSIAQHLMAAGHTIMEAATGRGAAETALSSRLDVIVLDHCLPDCQGFSLLTTLRRLAPDAGIVVISCACDGPEFQAQALRRGACGVLSKPFDLDHLRIEVGNAARAGRRPSSMPAAPDMLCHAQFYVEP